MKMQRKGKFFLIMFMLLIVIFAGFKFYINWTKTRALEERVDILRKKIEDSKEKNVKLKKNLKKIDDPEYIEKIARKKLGLVKPGEILLIPVEKD